VVAAAAAGAAHGAGRRAARDVRDRGWARTHLAKVDSVRDTAQGHYEMVKWLILPLVKVTLTWCVE